MVAIPHKLQHLPDGSVDIDAWLHYIKEQGTISDTTLIEKAIQLADETSKGLTTFYGQSRLEQGLLVATIVFDLKLDPDAIAASIIHSAYQHTERPLEPIKTALGEPIFKLVTSMQQMNLIKSLRRTNDKKSDSIQTDRLRKTILAMASDIRAVIIKLAEQTSIMRSIKHINPADRKRIAQETLDIYAPLANQLGIGQLKWELEDIAFHYTDPDTYKMIAKLLAERRIDREKRIHQTISSLEKHLQQAHISFSITGRAKHIYSIYSKMQKKDLGYQDIYDSSAVRILVPSVADCYETLSIVHHIWEHIPHEFDDYIANPKPNGYRSIHTAVMGDDGKHLEIQIRTVAMHEEAEHGIAAHWIYKENKLPHAEHENKIAALRQLLTWHHQVTQQDKPNQTTDTIFKDRVYAFTPKGDIFDMESGATVLDFAYHIHTEIGHRCRGAKINGHIVPLTQPLRSGDQVDIITSQHGTPSRDWLSKNSMYLKTARARSKVAQWFKHEAMLTTLGHGSIRAAHSEPHATASKPIIAIHPKAIPSQQTHFQIAGVDNLLTRIARCCKPIPGDPIIGYITQGRGITIHRLHCNNIASTPNDHENRLIKVSWDSKHLGSYYADLLINAQDNENLIKDISAVIANHRIDLISLNTALNTKNKIVTITLTLKIQNSLQLKQIMTELNSLAYVTSVKRLL